MRYYLIAGERSGDLHAGNLARALYNYDSSAQMRGFGGDYMEGAGVKIGINYKEVAIMGFWEVLTNLNKIQTYLKKCREDILSFQPDVVILVDYGGFNKRMAAWAKHKNIKVFYYISPKVWAWNQKRAIGLKATVDKMFVILPFEKEFYKKFDWNVDYVGNPVLDAIKAHKPSEDFFKKHQLPDTKFIALLPGSRKQEVTNIAEKMSEVVKSFPDHHFAVAAVNNLAPSVYDPLRNIRNVHFVLEDTYNLLQHSTAAVVTSGTATLETALFDVPQVVVYKTGTISYLIARSLIMVPFISLVNLVAGREVVKELIQNDLNVEKLTEELKKVLKDENRLKILDAYNEIRKSLDTGSASDNTARLMFQYLKQA
jgi:lipid-A-disaccharide synthase